MPNNCEHIQCPPSLDLQQQRYCLRQTIPLNKTYLCYDELVQSKSETKFHRKSLYFLLERFSLCFNGVCFIRQRHYVFAGVTSRTLLIVGRRYLVNDSH